MDEIKIPNALGPASLKQLNVASNLNRNTTLYCFNVGQGDTSLLITSENNAYLIDTNILRKNFDVFIEDMKNILKNHRVKDCNGKYILKAMIFTHKHLDHVRGAVEIILGEHFIIENFIINLDYTHKTGTAKNLLLARKKCLTTFNLNAPGQILEGDAKICFKNPDITTSTKKVAPDINNSSIVMCICHGGNIFYLTGDAEHHVLNKCPNVNKCPKVLNNCSHATCRNSERRSFLKVSHHGGKTGTSDDFLTMIKPGFAFISVGSKNQHGHPDKTVTDMLKRNCFETSMSIDPRVDKGMKYISEGNKAIDAKVLK